MVIVLKQNPDGNKVEQLMKRLRGMGLDVPECVKLVRALKERGMDLGEGLYRMEDVRAAIEREVGKC